MLVTVRIKACHVDADVRIIVQWQRADVVAAKEGARMS